MNCDDAKNDTRTCVVLRVKMLKTCIRKGIRQTVLAGERERERERERDR